MARRDSTRRPRLALRSRDPKCRGVLVLGNHRQSISVVRALARHGWRVVLGQPRSTRTSWVARSRSVDAVWAHPPFNAPGDVFASALAELLHRDESLRAIFPIGDTEIDAVNAVRKQFTGRVALVLPPAPAILSCRDKCVMLEMARTHGVPVADFHVLKTDVDIRRASESIGIPTVFKPISERARIFGGKAFVAHCAEDFSQAVQRCGLPRAPLIAQTFVTGPRFNLYYFATRGVVRAALMVRVLRTDRLDGTGYAVDAVTVPLSPAWLGHLERLVSEVRYDGAGCLQFIRDQRSGRESFLEINARLGANYRVAERFGLELAAWWVDQAIGGDPAVPQVFAYPPGRHMSWSFGDLDGLRATCAEGPIHAVTKLRWIKQSLRTLFRWNHLTWAWYDPLPTIWNYATFLRGLLRIERANHQRVASSVP